MEELLGKNVFIRTVTNFYTGRLAWIVDGVARLDDAAWIADTGRFSIALSKGSLSEVEPYPGSCYVSIGAIVDMCEWGHDLPRSVR